MTAWTAFAAVVGVVLALLLLLSWLTQRGMDSGAAATGEVSVERDGERDPQDWSVDPLVTVEVSRGSSEDVAGPDGWDADGDAADADDSDPTASAAAGDADPPAASSLPDGSPAAATLTDETTLSGGALLANVAASQGTFALVLVLAAVATGVPATALGVSAAGFGGEALLAGAALGIGLSAANQGAVRLFRHLDVAFSEELRTLLAPDSLGGWAALLLGVLPLVAVFEELLFRAILIGAFATGFGIDPWLLVVVSSGLFAAGHGAQGVGGVVVTGALGLVLGAAFVLTGSLAAVVVAHYLVNALEFLLHER